MRCYTSARLLCMVFNYAIIESKWRIAHLVLSPMLWYLWFWWLKHIIKKFMNILSWQNFLALWIRPHQLVIILNSRDGGRFYFLFISMITIKTSYSTMQVWHVCVCVCMCVCVWIVFTSLMSNPILDVGMIEEYKIQTISTSVLKLVHVCYICIMSEWCNQFVCITYLLGFHDSIQLTSTY